MKKELAYVKLMNEGTDVFRPVEIVKVDSRNFVLLDNNYNPEDEGWSVRPGNIVKLKKHKTMSGNDINICVFAD